MGKVTTEAVAAIHPLLRLLLFLSGLRVSGLRVECKIQRRVLCAAPKSYTKRWQRGDGGLMRLYRSASRLPPSRISPTVHTSYDNDLIVKNAVIKPVGKTS
jgi:hypothetical protein